MVQIRKIKLFLQALYLDPIQFFFWGGGRAGWMQGGEESVVFLVGKVTKGGRTFKEPNLKAFMTTLSQDLSSFYT